MRIIGTAEAQKFADENGMLYHECFSNDWKTFKKVYFSLVHMIINPLLDSVSGEPVSLMHVKAMTAGFVRTRTAISYDDKLAYTSMLEASEQNDELTTAVDWL
ncbi:hypothetical protein HK100_009744 [Physocladia obscura]|uniref:Uncharacterized protein n=1 Tax=Physocladia obscura TaxID=109957 RepID=A0AAD5T5P8_9FUNG|nr:hypothetical protein HK100_009744 [Physocladia obscura]